MKIIFASDFHFGTSHRTSGNIKATAKPFQEALREDTGQNFLAGLKRMDPKMDLLVLGGDYVTGRDQPKDYTEMSNLLSKIGSMERDYFSGTLGEPWHDRIVAIPGNHDVERGKNGPSAEFIGCFSGIRTPYSIQEEISQSAPSPLFIYDEIRLIVYLISTTEYSGQATGLVMKLEEAIKPSKLKKEVRAAVNDFEFLDPAVVSNVDIERFHKLNAALGKNYATYTRMCIGHHPLLELPGDNEAKAFSTPLNAGHLMQALVEHGYRFYFHGHTHRDGLVEIRPLPNLDSFFHVSIPALGAPTGKMKVVSLDIQDGFANISVKKWQPALQAFETEHNYERQKFSGKAYGIQTFRRC